MLAGVYSKHTLNGNWAEERAQPPPAPKERFVREAENDIPLSRLSRQVQGPTYGVPDDGFPSQTKSITHEHLCPLDERGVSMFDKPEICFIDDSGVPEVSYEERRPCNDVPRTGFCGVLSRHDKTEGARYWHTSTGLSYKNPEGLDQDGRLKTLRQKAAGVPCVKEHETVLKGILTGEPLDLIDQIPVQRSWMANFDPGLKQYLASNGTSGFQGDPKVDNELSLPLGEGYQKKVQEELKARNGKFYRNSTVITTGKQKTDAVCIFDDYP